MRYETTMTQMGNNTGIEVPGDILDQLGGGRRPAVKVVVNGFAFDSTVGVMGGHFLIPFSADRRAASGIKGGDAVTVDIELDTEPRTTVVPDDLAVALAAAGVTQAFDALAPSKRKAHVTNVEGAKAEDTRARRIAAIVTKLQE